MGVSAYLSFIRGRRAWALIRGWALINFFCLWDGRLFEVGANSRLGAYSNKYGICASGRKHIPTIQQTSHTNDFLNAKNHAREKPQLSGSEN